jgi:poly-gamma-glutamate capsule biosynthesis protein CapA/YwtB (metallophosphatase superfamily)
MMPGPARPARQDTAAGSTARDAALCFVGDVMLDHPLLRKGPDATGQATLDAYAVLQDADLAVINLEVALTNGGTPASKLVTMRADPGLAGELSRIGCRVATIANNHALDYGIEGLLDTLDALAEVRITTVGGGRDLDAAMAPAILTARERRIAMLSFATTLPHGFAARPGVPGIAPVRVRTSYLYDSETLDEVPGMSPYVVTEADPDDVERVCGAIRSARGHADLVIVAAHWGIPNGWIAAHQGPLAGYQQPLGRALIDAGADAIVGHNAHMLHGAELYRGRPILYSLGDFVFHTHAAGRKIAIRRTFPPYNTAPLHAPVTKLSCVVRMLAGAAGIRRTELVPLILNALGEPELIEDDRAEAVLAFLDEQSAPLGARVRRDGTRGVLVEDAAC